MTDPITIVSGLPRSGTSMMMRILHAGGIEPVTDNVRTADVDNPGGYYELERVKQMDKDAAWLPAARGKAFKMVSTLLPKLPTSERYQVLFMRRNMDEILASQAKMLERMGKPAGPADGRMAQLFTRHLADIEDWLRAQPNMAVLYLRYDDVVHAPDAAAEQLQQFLGRPLDTQKMTAVVDQALYRNKA